ncbi:MAG: adenylate/guanylate cyclase domain-containing protein [Pseudomonadota bacterium]
MRWRAAHWAVLALSLLWAAGLGVWHLRGEVGPLDRAEAVTLDWRHVLAPMPGRPDGMVIYAIDDQAVFMAGGYPIPRHRLASAVETLAEAGAAAIGVDVLLLDPTSEENDAALEQALRNRPVVLAAGGRAGSPFIISPEWTSAPDPAADQSAPSFPSLTRLARPLPRFQDNAVDAPALVVVDGSGTPRHAPLLFTPNDAPATVAPSFVVAMAVAAGYSDVRFGPDAIEVGGRSVPLDLNAQLAMRFLGPTGTIETRSLATLWRDGLPTDIEDSLVLMGATATGAGDAFATPYDARLPGVEVLATAIANLMDGTALRRDMTVRWIDVGGAFALTAIAVVLVLATPGWIGPVATLGVLIAWLAATALAFAWAGWWLAIAFPVAAAVPAALLALAVRQTLEWRDRGRLGRTATAYGALQSPVITRALAEDPSFLDQPRHQDATIMFLDLVGFTPLADRLGAEGSQALLSDFHRQVADAVNATGGYVSSWLGDGMMVVFGLPKPEPNDTLNAFKAALDILKRLPGVPQVRSHAIRLKIGITAGPVVVSRLGGGGHGHITATGMTVNRAARLMAAAGVAGVPLLADPTVRDRLPADLAVKLSALAKPLTLAGFSSPVDAVALADGTSLGAGYRLRR